MPCQDEVQKSLFSSSKQGLALQAPLCERKQAGITVNGGLYARCKARQCCSICEEALQWCLHTPTLMRVIIPLRSNLAAKGHTRQVWQCSWTQTGIFKGYWCQDLHSHLQRQKLPTGKQRLLPQSTAAVLSMFLI